MKDIKNTVRDYLIVSGLSIFLLIWILELWKADFNVPLSARGDALFNLMTIKSIADTGWYLHNDFVGAPFGLDSHDLPMSEGLNLIILKLLAKFLNSTIALNLFFIATFPLIAITSFFVFRCLKISSAISIVASLLYTFLPYHFLRGLDHLFLAAYYMVPLITLITLSVWSNKLPLVTKIPNHLSEFKGKLWNLLNVKSILCIIICIIVGSTGVYYAFFACLFIAVASISAFIYKRDKKIFLFAAILIAIISFSVFFNILPSLIYTYRYGMNREVAQRFSSDSEIYGLKIIHLLLPIDGHRIALFRKLVNKYLETKPPLQNENTYAALGIIGSIGFLCLLFRSVFICVNNEIKKPSLCVYDRLAVLNISAILFANIGGFSSIFAVYVSPQIRAGNRISIFIAFFSLLAISLFLESIKKQYINNRRNKKLFNLLLFVVLCIGIADQTSPNFIPAYSKEKQVYISDRNFVHAIEKDLPTGSMVFQLPYVSFPENPPVNKMIDYDLFRGYLHSKNLRWSYGAMNGRNFNWHQTISEQPLDSLLSKISVVGFSGIYIDRYGYSDSGKQIETELEKKLSIKPIVSENGRLMLFNMNVFNDAFLSLYTKEQIEAYKWLILNPIQSIWKEGFYPQEKNLKEGNWRWSNQQSSLIINNPTSKVRKTKISMALATGWAENSNLRIESDLFSEVVKINNKPSVFSKTILLPPGKHRIKFSSDAQQLNRFNDPRKLVFRVFNLKFREEQEKIFEYSKLDDLNVNDVEWKEGFYPPENNLKEGTWRWSNQQSTLIINNPTSTAKEAQIIMALATGWQDYSNLRIESNLFSEVVKINNKPSVFSKTILLPPGKHLIKFSSDAQQFNAPNDSRKLFFRVFNPKLKLD